MPINASIGFSSVGNQMLASSQRLKVVRVYAELVLAFVMRLFPLRDRANKYFIRECVGMDSPSWVFILDSAVAFSGRFISPDPASGIWIKPELFEESFKQRSWKCHINEATQALNVICADELRRPKPGLKTLVSSLGRSKPAQT